MNLLSDKCFFLKQSKKKNRKLDKKKNRPWIFVERFASNVTYKVRDLVSAEPRQLRSDQLKVVKLPV